MPLVQTPTHPLFAGRVFVRTSWHSRHNVSSGTCCCVTTWCSGTCSCALTTWTSQRSRPQQCTGG